MIQTDTYFVDVTRAPLDLDKLYGFCVTENSGGVDIFVGTVRDHFDGRKVKAIDYQGYPEMAEAVMKRIMEDVRVRWPVNRMAVQHRLGLLTLKEASVVIVVSAAHRAEAFEACRYVIEAVKKDLPVWKKEFFDDGSVEWKLPHVHRNL
jgi:molybdopterin synthase catalytic subunit